MFYLLLMLGLVSTATGVFVVGFGIPIRETMFGSSLLVAGSVAITGGFITLGLAAAVAELRSVIQALKARIPAVSRPTTRTTERKEADRRTGMPLPLRPAVDPPSGEAASLPSHREPPASAQYGSAANRTQAGMAAARLCGALDRFTTHSATGLRAGPSSQRDSLREAMAAPRRSPGGSRFAAGGDGGRGAQIPQPNRSRRSNPTPSTRFGHLGAAGRLTSGRPTRRRRRPGSGKPIRARHPPYRRSRSRRRRNRSDPMPARRRS